ncbi:hypothetical protein XHC_3326 [Xanthomonas hortorum pv. carotae str. M081]|nr:hypothetical protein XHC_3326 [Xanthomonas hortorum pv. carotae str. M081]
MKDAGRKCACCSGECDWNATAYCVARRACAPDVFRVAETACAAMTSASDAAMLLRCASLLKKSVDLPLAHRCERGSDAAALPAAPQRCVVCGAFCEAGQALAVSDQRAALYHL